MDPLAVVSQGLLGASGSGTGSTIYVGKTVELQKEETKELVKRETRYTLVKLKDKELVKQDE